MKRRDKLSLLALGLLLVGVLLLSLGLTGYGLSMATPQDSGDPISTSERTLKQSAEMGVGIVLVLVGFLTFWKRKG